MAKRKSRGTSPEMIDFFKRLRWYPEANVSDHYVFLNTLAKDNPSLYSAAQSLLKINGKIDDFKEEAHFDNALKFLLSASLSERSKEINFLRSKGLEVPDDINFIDLIKLINEAIVGFEELQRRIEIEQNRRNIKGTGAYSYTQAMGSYIKSALHQLRDPSKDRNTIAGVVRSSLIRATKKFSGSLDINQIASVIGATQSQIMAEITEELQVDGLAGKIIKDKYLNKDGSINQPEVEKLIKKTKSFQDNFGNNSLKKINELQMMANNITSKYSLVLSSAAKKQIKAKFKNLPKNSQNKIDWKNISNDKEIMSSITDLNAEDIYVYSFEKNTGMGGEARIYQDLRNSIVNWVGGAGGKIDVTSFILGEVEVKEKKDNKIINNALQKISENITQKTQSEFEKVGKNISLAYDSIEEVLQKISEELGELQQSFIIHTNIKDYYTSAQDNKFSGFEGGVWGGISIAESLAALNQAGFPTSDIDWLKTCLVNTAQAAIGASNKENLEKYLSIFVTMLLFDDGITIAQDVSKDFQSTSLNVLHLFPVNGIYVPSSFVMSEVYNSLSAFDFSSAAYAKINPGSVNFSQELSNMSTPDNKIYGPPRWRAISDKQISAMSVRIKFLANFSDILNHLTSS